MVFSNLYDSIILIVRGKHLKTQPASDPPFTPSQGSPDGAAWQALSTQKGNMPKLHQLLVWALLCIASPLSLLVCSSSSSSDSWAARGGDPRGDRKGLVPIPLLPSVLRSRAFLCCPCLTQAGLLTEKEKHQDSQTSSLSTFSAVNCHLRERTLWQAPTSLLTHEITLTRSVKEATRGRKTDCEGCQVSA